MNTPQNTSRLVSRFIHYIEIDATEKVLLNSLETEEITFGSRVKLHLRDLSSSSYVLKKGWLYQYVDLPDGGRQILKVHLPGEIVGLDDVSMKDSFNETMTATEVVISPFPKEKLQDVFLQSPRLSALFFNLILREKAILEDRIKMIGRHTAVNKVANFMLELHARLNLNSTAADFNSFEMPLTQEVIADVLGLTNVSVSNAFTQLHEEGKMTYDRDTVTIHNIDQLKRDLEFNDHHLRIDKEMLPE